MIWREILLQLAQLLNHSRDEGDDYKWSIPSAVSTEEHKEVTVRQILHHLGTFSSDEALVSKILEFFAHRTALALSHARHSADVMDRRFDLLRLRSFKRMSLHSWTSAPTDTLSITKVNVWQCLSSLVLWTLRKTGRESVCCVLVLNSVTSTPQWIRQPEAAWLCVWCLCAWCLRVSMCSDILGSLSL
jgi:hypothetical protein